jgi:hypothetical protein
MQTWTMHQDMLGAGATLVLSLFPSRLQLDVPEAPEPIMVGRGHDNPWGLGFSRSMGSTRVAVAWWVAE